MCTLTALYHALSCVLRPKLAHRRPSRFPRKRRCAYPAHSILHYHGPRPLLDGRWRAASAWMPARLACASGKQCPPANTVGYRRRRSDIPTGGDGTHPKRATNHGHVSDCSHPTEHRRDIMKMFVRGNVARRAGESTPPADLAKSLCWLQARGLFSRIAGGVQQIEFPQQESQSIIYK